MISTSELLTFQACPQKWAFLYDHRRVPALAPPDARDRGSTAHAALDAAVEHAPDSTLWWHQFMSAFYEARCAERGVQPSPKHMAEIEILSHSLHSFWLEHSPEALSRRGESFVDSELALSTPDGFVGMLDFLRRDANGQLWHRQYKTTGRKIDIPKVVIRCKHSLHEPIYDSLVKTHFGEHLRGTELVIFPLDSLHTRKAGTKCTHCGTKGYEFRAPIWERFEMAIDTHMRERAIRDLKRVRSQIKAASPPHEQREGSCFGFGRECEFLPVCMGKLSISDDNYFRDRDPYLRYAERLNVEAD